MNYDSKLIGELASIMQAEMKLWAGFRIDKRAQKPFQVIRHSEPGLVDPRVMAAYVSRDEAVAATQRLPIEAGLAKVLARIEELEI